MHLPFWLTTALLFPVLLYQGKRARKTTPRLPEGQYGEGQPQLRLLVIGESTAASVGAFGFSVPELSRNHGYITAGRDGYHPDGRGYRAIAEALACQELELLRPLFGEEFRAYEQRGRR